ncbi:MAG: rhodanese-like domain-containing protein [Gammaproteobacteria bacterium HGW-Gammaproteobacteria-1]|jgi:rhodanese-related sulfurtransferase|nr:MAG: rhodanese-like domain-containing protein [Gammaproteobacteria bacterium HGW-Gammaproteobacteria-1]
MRYLACVLLLCAAMPAAADKPLAPDTVPGTLLVSAEQAVVTVQTTPQMVIIDSRLGEEYAKGHIPGAINLLDTDMTEAALSRIAPDRATPLLFYCNGERCLRSSNAAAQAASWGYGTVYWFRGGWQEWLRQELPVAR